MEYCSKEVLNKGAWSGEEDRILASYIATHGIGKWASLPERAGLRRSGKSCRLRWLNYLRPDIKRGNISHDEEELIIRLHKLLGNRWSLIAGRLPGRTDNEIKNYWNTTLAKRLRGHLSSHVPVKHRPQPKHVSSQALAGGAVQPPASADVVRANFEQESCMPPTAPPVSADVVRANFEQEACMPSLLGPEGSEGCSNNTNSSLFGSNSPDEPVAAWGLIAQTPSELDARGARCDGISDRGFSLDYEFLSFDAATIGYLRENDCVQADSISEINVWLFS